MNKIGDGWPWTCEYPESLVCLNKTNVRNVRFGTLVLNLISNLQVQKLKPIMITLGPRIELIHLNDKLIKKKKTDFKCLPFQTDQLSLKLIFHFHYNYTQGSLHIEVRLEVFAETPFFSQL